MDWKYLTRYFMALIVVVVIAYDVVAYLKAGGSATISSQIWDLSRDHPVIGLSFGYLMGHLFPI